MKRVLIVDAPPLFREYLKDKLVNEKITVDCASGSRDAFTKMISTLPDLMIIDAPDDMGIIFDFLDMKRKDPNASQIPVILTGPVLSRESVAKLPYFNVIKYFNKPIKFDVFFESIGKVLRIALSIDTTPSILELHLNDNIIFIEIAQGLNREKIALLKYKLTEMIDGNKLSKPKVVIMLTDLRLSFVDGANLEFLFDNVIADERILPKNVKILSFDEFTKELIDGHPAYTGMSVVENLSSVLSSLVEGVGDVTETITDRILSATDDSSEGSVQMRFYAEGVVADNDESEKKLDTSLISIAIVDDDQITRNLLKAAFQAHQVETELFDSGLEFLVSTKHKTFDLVILDIFMPGVSGLDILTTLRQNKYNSPVIIYSSATQREAVIQALSLGAKSFIAKPMKPEIVVQKALEVLHSL